MLKRVERFKLGIERYGYDSDFRRTIEAVVDQYPIDVKAIDKVFDEYGIEK
jgi:hypothetical protein